LVKKEENEGP